MLYPLFDSDINHVGWIEPGEHIFDTNMNWVAYISDNHAWSSDSGNWLGPVNHLVCLDKSGKVVLWNPDGEIAGTLRPLRPVRALRALRPLKPLRQPRPLRPSRPLRPIHGWSDLSFIAWANQ
ncbi:4-fold beta flower protein [Bacillus anthracis]|uniref:4-fold beta flower protein n=1 Tax=Bacillus anthracis TaxID=1392 RepID=UPI003D25F7D5